MNENEADSTPGAVPGSSGAQRRDCPAAAGSAQREPGASPAVSAIPPRPDWLKPVQAPPPKNQARCPKPFAWWGSVLDEKTTYADKPEGAKPAHIGHRCGWPSYYVPVSFAAKDWNVTPRRIRALLCDGRLAGRLQENGYWEVVYPYSFTFGTRGPGLKRQQKQERLAA